MSCGCIGNYHEPNVDWLICELKKAIDEIEEMKKEVENLKPIVTDIINQYVDDGTMLNIINQSVLNRKFLIVGDSYALGYSQSGILYTPFPEYLSANSNITVECVATSGAGFANAGTGPGEGKNFLATLQAYGGEKNKITDIIVAGGYNDRTHNNTDITVAIKDFYSYAVQNFPNAKISVAFIGWSLFSSEYEQLRATAQTYSTCGLYGMAYIGGAENILHQVSFFDSDGIHPNSLGQIAIGTYLGSFLRNGSVDVFKDLGALNFPAYNGVSFPTTYMTQHENNILIYTQGKAVLDMSRFAASTWADSFYQITGELADSPLKGYFTAVITNVCLYRTADDTNYQCAPCTLRITNGTIYLQLLAYNNGTAYTGTLKDIIIPAFSTIIDSILS